MAKYNKRFKKVTPFRYPYKRHIWSETPLKFSDYRKYKPYLKREFNNKCVYCRKSDTLEDISGFHVEHYRPKTIFKDLIADYSNLFYSCAACNRYKSDYWSDDESKMIVNPCDYVMSKQLKFQAETIVSLSSPGKTTVELLRLNNDQSLKYRKLTQELIMNFLHVLSEADLRKQYTKAEQSIELLAQLIGESTETVKSALKIS